MHYVGPIVQFVCLSCACHMIATKVSHILQLTAANRVFRTDEENFPLAKIIRW